MNTPYFTTHERRTALREAMKKWLGTPWCANSDAVGPRGGVICHLLVRSLYIDSGWLPPGFPRPPGNPRLLRHSKVPLIEPFMDARPEFARCPLTEALVEGDMIGIQIYAERRERFSDHFGIVGEGNQFIHVLMRKRVEMDTVTASPWREQLRAAWRPLEFR